MGFECNLSFGVQIATIIASVFGIIAYIIYLVHGNLGGVITAIFGLLFCLLLIVSEVYVFNGMKYVAFVLTIWGKGVMFLFLGFLIFARSGYPLFTAIFFWVMFVAYVVLFIIAKGTSPPLMQKNSPPEFEVSEADYYQQDGGAPPNVSTEPAIDPAERRYTDEESKPAAGFCAWKEKGPQRSAFECHGQAAA
jgi:hypothetical protein